MRGALYLLCGVVGGLAGGLLVRAVAEEQQAPRAEVPRRVSDTPTREEFARLSERIRRLEHDTVAPAAPRPAAVEDDKPAPAPALGTADTPKAPGEVEGAKEKRTPQEVVKALLGKPFGHNEANRLVWWLSRHKDDIAAVIEGIEEEIARNPNDPHLHVALAAARTAELINQPAGPQQGLMWGKVSAAYDAALALDPNHWQARFGKAFGTARAPDWLGLRPEAIRQFEELRQIQSRGAPEPEHAHVYFQLGMLYKDTGNAEKARTLWAEGLKLFPDNEQLKDMLEASTKK